MDVQDLISEMVEQVKRADGVSEIESPPSRMMNTAHNC